MFMRVNIFYCVSSFSVFKFSYFRQIVSFMQWNTSFRGKEHMETVVIFNIFKEDVDLSGIR